VTARDKAIESMVDATDYDLRYRLGASGTCDLLGAMLDLIPAEVLAQLAIERGGLVQEQVLLQPCGAGSALKALFSLANEDGAA